VFGVAAFISRGIDQPSLAKNRNNPDPQKPRQRPERYRMLSLALNVVEIILLGAIVYGQHRSKAAWDVLTQGAAKVADKVAPAVVKATTK
jgi:hypothetical protein